MYKSADSSRARSLNRVLALYDEALAACVRKDKERLTSALDLLDGSLDFSVWPELGIQLASHYRCCKEWAARGRFHQAGAMLFSLRNAWAGRTPSAPAA